MNIDYENEADVNLDFSFHRLTNKKFTPQSPVRKTLNKDVLSKDKLKIKNRPREFNTNFKGSL